MKLYFDDIEKDAQDARADELDLLNYYTNIGSEDYQTDVWDSEY